MTFAVKLDTLFKGPGAAAPAFGRGCRRGHRMEALIEAGRELAGHRPLDELFPLILQSGGEGGGRVAGHGDHAV